MRVLLTAGFDRAPNVVALAELLRRDGHEVVGVLVVTPYSVARLRAMIRQHGTAIVLRSLRRLVGMPGAAGEEDPVEAFLREQAIQRRSLRRWCAGRRVPYHVVATLNSERAVGIVAQSRPEIVIYGGGGILRTPFLQAAGRRVLNAHSGPLPAIRGMNACEWSLLLDVPPAVTIHFIDEGIDTGEILETIPLPVDPTDTVARLRAKCVVLGIEGLRRAVGSPARQDCAPTETRGRERQCFVMAPVLRDLLEWRLSNAKMRQKQTV